jgi:hypothetical protein
MFIAAQDQLSLRRVKGSTELSMAVRDKEGNTVVQVTNNHWLVSKNNSTCWDKNFTGNTLEVKDGSRRVVFQARLFADGAQLQFDLGGGTSAHFADAERWDSITGIIPMFAYPSDLHLGEFSRVYFIR